MWNNWNNGIILHFNLFFIVLFLFFILKKYSTWNNGIFLKLLILSKIQFFTSMNFRNNHKKEWVLDHIGIIEIAQNYGLRPRRNGQGKWFINCPIHNENTPSCCLFENTNTYKCFGCGAHGNVIDLVVSLENTDFKTALERLYNGNDVDYTPRPIPPQKAIPQKFFDRKLIVNQLISEKSYENNIFVNWLVKHFEGTLDSMGIEITKERILNLGKEYGLFLGQSSAHVCFPYIDLEKRICQVKTMKYEQRESDLAVHDCKSVKPESRTLSSAAGYQFTCLFGTHLIKPDHILCLCESEKTALIGTLYHQNQNFLFLAVGGQKHAPETFSFFKDLKNNCYCLFPDHDALEKRNEKGNESMLMRTAQTLFSLGIDPINLITTWLNEIPVEKQKKADFADYLIWNALPF